MARRRKVCILAAELAVENVEWEDHAEINSAEFDPEIITLSTTGVVIYEDDKQVMIALSLRSDEAKSNLYDMGDMTAAQILKSNIVRRTKIGSIPWPPT